MGTKPPGDVVAGDREGQTSQLKSGATQETLIAGSIRTAGSPTCLAYARARGRDGTSKTAPRPEKASGTDHGLGRRFLRRSWLPPEKHSGNRNRADCEPIHADPRIAIQMDAENWVI